MSVTSTSSASSLDSRVTQLETAEPAPRTTTRARRLRVAGVPGMRINPIFATPFALASYVRRGGTARSRRQIPAEGHRRCHQAASLPTPSLVPGRFRPSVHGTAAARPSARASSEAVDRPTTERQGRGRAEPMQRARSRRFGRPPGPNGIDLLVAPASTRACQLRESAARTPCDRRGHLHGSDRPNGRHGAVTRSH